MANSEKLLKFQNAWRDLFEADRDLLIYFAKKLAEYSGGELDHHFLKDAIKKAAGRTTTPQPALSHEGNQIFYLHFKVSGKGFGEKEFNGMGKRQIDVFIEFCEWYLDRATKTQTEELMRLPRTARPAHRARELIRRTTNIKYNVGKNNFAVYANHNRTSVIDKIKLYCKVAGLEFVDLRNG